MHQKKMFLLFILSILLMLPINISLAENNDPQPMALSNSTITGDFVFVESMPVSIDSQDIAVALAGWTGNHMYSTAKMVCTTLRGELLWTFEDRYPDSEFNTFRSIVPLSDGTIGVLHQARVNGQYMDMVIALKDNEKLWTYMFPYEVNELHAADGGFITIHQTDSDFFSSRILTKYDDQGNMEWERLYDYSWSIGKILPVQNGYICIGSQQDDIDSTATAVIFKIDHNGNMEWLYRSECCGSYTDCLPLEDESIMVVGDVWPLEKASTLDLPYQRPYLEGIIEMYTPNGLVWSTPYCYGEEVDGWMCSVVPYENAYKVACFSNKHRDIVEQKDNILRLLTIDETGLILQEDRIAFDMFRFIDKVKLQSHQDALVAVINGNTTEDIALDSDTENKATLLGSIQ